MAGGAAGASMSVRMSRRHSPHAAIAAVAAGAALMLSPAPSLARGRRAWDQHFWTQAAVAVAHDYWGPLPKGDPVVNWTTKLPVDIAGRAYPGQDRIDVALDFARDLRRHHWWSLYCTLITHEYGHLAGQEHVDDPTKIMYPTVLLTFAPSEQAALRYPAWSVG